MAQPQRAKHVLTLEDVPAIPDDVAGELQPNGDIVVVDGDQRWRFGPDGETRYYLKTQPGQGRDVLPWEEVYSGSGRRR